MPLLISLNALPPTDLCAQLQVVLLPAGLFLLSSSGTREDGHDALSPTSTKQSAVGIQ